VLILTFVRKPFTEEREMITKQVNFKKRKKGSKNRAKKIRRYSHFTKRYAVTPTAQKDSPLSHKSVELFFFFFCKGSTPRSHAGYIWTIFWGCE